MTPVPRSRPRRILSVGHSYVVGLNRRLAHEIARAGGERWEITAVAPRFMHGDLGPIRAAPILGELARLETVTLRASRRIHLMTYGRELREVLRRSHDLVHAWEEPYILAGGQIARWTPKGTPYVFWTAQNIAKRYPPPFSWVERYCLERSAGWMACGESVMEALLPRGYDRRPHRVVPLGVDVEHFRPDSLAGEAVRNRLGWGGGAPVVGYLGRFTPEKGLPLLMRALDVQRAPWRALFVGGGPLEGELRGWAQRHGDRVRVVTGVSHQEVPVHINAMDILCAPSQTTSQWREQFGRMLVEAFACGVPVLASDSGEIPHVVDSAGWIVGEADEAGWGRAVGELLQNADLREELAARGLQRAREAYAWPVIAQRYLSFFSEILDGA